MMHAVGHVVARENGWAGVQAPSSVQSRCRSGAAGRSQHAAGVRVPQQQRLEGFDLNRVPPVPHPVHMAPSHCVGE
jgi:hypothetical protein